MRDAITIERTIAAPLPRVFKALVTPDDLLAWHHAGDGWYTPKASVDAVIGGHLIIGYSSADGSETFELDGTITVLSEPTHLAYTFGLGDELRLVTYDLTDADGATQLKLMFDIEHINAPDLQRAGWTQHIDNLQTYLEAQ